MLLVSILITRPGEKYYLNPACIVTPHTKKEKEKKRSKEKQVRDLCKALVRATFWIPLTCYSLVHFLNSVACCNLTESSKKEKKREREREKNRKNCCQRCPCHSKEETRTGTAFSDKYNLQSFPSSNQFVYKEISLFKWSLQLVDLYGAIGGSCTATSPADFEDR